MRAGEQAVGGHVVAVDDNPGVGRVEGPAHAAAVVGAPRPDVVADHAASVAARLAREWGDMSADPPVAGNGGA